MLKRFLLLAALAPALVPPVACAEADAPSPTQPPGTAAPAAPGLVLTGDVSPVHDPAAVLQGGTAHLFCTTSQDRDGLGLIAWRTSTDLRSWTRAGSVFTALPAWAIEAVPGTRGIWAPDIAYAGGEYRLYYSVSTFGKNTSVIGLVVTKTLDRSDPQFGWVDKGLVLRSQATDDFNAIDPDLLVEEGGKHWLSFGSFWTGLKLVELDPATGKPPAGPLKLIDIARRPDPPDAIEAPKIIKRNGWYYLFASMEFCCRGVESTYYTVVGRSDAPTGPFRDDQGRSLLEGGGRTFLHADQDPTRRWVGPGHMTILATTEGDYVAYHAYDRLSGGRPTLRIQRIAWGADGWPVAQ